MLLFKYFSPQAVDHVFARDGEVAIRFAFPRDYNDPYELFLRTGPLDADEYRAFYKYFLGQIANFPVTCFSRRPDSVVMWAHYGRDGSGICLGLDEDALTDQFPVAYVGDVVYTDEPAQIDARLVEHAATTLKARHTEWLLNAGYGAAYFTKRDDWEYEAERRIVVDEQNLHRTDNGLIARLPMATLRYIILGPRTSTRIDDLCRAIAIKHGIAILRFKTGKTCYEPFFDEDASHDPMLWNGVVFELAESVCDSCLEPVPVNDDGECGSCTISSEAAAQAGRGSQLTIAAHFGLHDVSVSFHGAEAKGYKITTHEAKAED